MKKFLKLLLACLLSITLVGCSSDDTTTITPDKKEETVQKEEIKFEEVVLENDYCRIAITEIDPDAWLGYEMKVELENKTDDILMMFAIDDAYVNDVKCDPFFAEEVAGGKKMNTSFTFPVDDLEKQGIKEFTDFCISFRVYNSDDWLEDEYLEEEIHIYPYGNDKAKSFKRTDESSDTVILDDDQCKVVVLNYEQDDIFGYTAHLYIENKTDKEMMVAIDDASINGYMADPVYATSLQGNKVTFSSCSWSNFTLEENNIESIDEIEFTLRTYVDNDIFNAKETPVTLHT